VSGTLAPGVGAQTDGRRLSGAIRAEQIRIAGTPTALAGLDTVLTGHVSDAIFEGERVVYEIAVPSLEGLVLRVFDHDPAGHSQYATGEPVSIGWNARDMLVFAQD
jgi:putative spermidine/putrescine transport system ATP-binding protein